MFEKTRREAGPQSVVSSYRSASHSLNRPFSHPGLTGNEEQQEASPL